MAKFKKIDKQDFIDTYKDCGGKITAVCKHLRISRDCFYDNLRKYEEVALMVDLAENELVDTLEQTALAMATGKAKTRIENGKTVFDGFEVRPNQELLMFMLKAKGKKRGYVDKQEVDMKVEGEMNSKIKVEWKISDK